MRALTAYLVPIVAMAIASRGRVRLRFDRWAAGALVAAWILLLAAVAVAPGNGAGRLVAGTFGAGSLALVLVLLRSGADRRIATLAGLGSLANLVPIAANGGMPVRSASRAILAPEPMDEAPLFAVIHREVDSGPLLWLGDVLPVSLPGLAMVVSVGDVLIVAALVCFARNQGRRGSQASVTQIHSATLGSAARRWRWASARATTGASPRASAE